MRYYFSIIGRIWIFERLHGKKVKNLSLEAIQQVARTEEAARAQKAEAQAQAKRLVAEAKKEGEALLADARRQAEVEAGALLAQAEERANLRTAQIAAQYKEECAALRGAAEAKLDEAAALIVRRVVSS